MINKPDRPRSIANDMVDAVEAATSKWTRQKKSEERHPGMVRYRMSRMTKEPRTSRRCRIYDLGNIAARYAPISVFKRC
jgi:hypothetical protein